MAISNKRTIKDFDTNISIKSPLDIMTPENLLSTEDYVMVKDVFDLISKYRTATWISDMSITEMHSDLLRLQASLVSMMFRFGPLTSYCDGLKEQIKIARSKVRVNSKTLKHDYEDNGDSVSVTAEDLDNLSYTKTENIWIEFEKSRIAADFVKFVYFAAKDHVAMLDHTIQRLARLE